MKAVLTLLILVPLGAQDIYDLLLKGGQVIDPKNKRHERLDIGIAQGKIAKIAKAIPAAHARRVVDVSDYIVTPGLIDIQTKPNNKHHSLRSGVTTIAGLPPGKVLTHIYGPDEPDLAAARAQGRILDVGHGSSGFLFRVAIPAIKAGLLPDTITTDMDRESLLLPRANMTNVMSKFLAMGLTLEQVIERTTVNTANAIHRPDIGSLEAGGRADIAVLEIRNGPVAYLDSSRAKLKANTELRCILTIEKGTVVWDSEGLSLTNWKDAGPYSNFK